MPQLLLRDHEASHIEDVRRLSESDRDVIYELARRWRERADHAANDPDLWSRHSPVSC